MLFRSQRIANQLSLWGEQARPALTVHIPTAADGSLGSAWVTRDAVLTQMMSWDMAVEAELAGNDFGSSIADLGRVARILYKRCFGRVVVAKNIGHIIVEQSVFAVGRAMAKYCLTRDIPVISRIRDVSN